MRTPTMKADAVASGHADWPASSASGKLGVCVLTWNSLEVLPACLGGLSGLRDRLSVEILVVDNASRDGTAEFVRSAYPHVRLVANAINLGYSRGNNIGARRLLEMGCEYLLFVNPDVVVDAAMVQRMLDVLIVRPEVGLAGGREDRSTVSFRNRPTVLEKLLLYGRLRYLPGLRSLLQPLISSLSRHHYVAPSALNDGDEVHAVSGACILFRADAFRAAGGLDENTFLYEEELIMSERLRASGWPIVAVPGAVYRHANEHSTKQIPLTAYRCFIRSEQHLLRVYYRWTWPATLFLLAFRYLEFIPYAVLTCIRQRVSGAGRVG
jgi:GT2 family glycosyltransferase